MRHPPQTNYPPDTVPTPVSRSRVRYDDIPGWYLTGDSAFAEAAPQSLPPMLSKNIIISMPSCSKASRGLFVQLRAAGIFTGSGISPSPSLRQFSSRYAIRAGRNLPDKEFRYLRQCVTSSLIEDERMAQTFLLCSPDRAGVRTITSFPSVEGKSDV